MDTTRYPSNPALEAAVVADPDDDAPRLVYADWLDDHGDPHRAKYIRARCALDGRPPGDDYTTVWEEYREADTGMWFRPDPELPPPFTLSHSYGRDEEWWGDDHDGMERGFPSFASIDTSDIPNENRLLPGLTKLVRTTTVRGLDLAHVAPEWLPAILAAPAARAVTRLSLGGGWSEGRCPRIAALVASPVVPGLTRLAVGGVGSEADVDALAAAPFERLRRFDAHHIPGRPAVVKRLVASPWFRRLHRLLIGFKAGKAGVRALSGMAHLHTLCLWVPEDAAVLALGGVEFPALRRLLVHAANLRNEHGAALGRVRAPNLIELWLRNSGVNKGDVAALARTPLFDRLRAITFDGTALNAEGLKALAASPSAAGLRILRIRDGTFQSLRNSPLTRPGAFPELTTLWLSQPYPSRVKARDTAPFLAALATPKLRRLAIEYSNFDDTCAEAVATNPSFAGLTQLSIRYGTMGVAGARKLFRSPNLRHLISLQVFNCPIARAAADLADPAVLPECASCWLDSCQVPDAVAKRLKKRRPQFIVS
jgi:uncharacterized protein (TIGR02996 family)